MIAILRYVFRQLLRRRLRTAAGVAGIFLTLALLTSIQIAFRSVATSYTDLVALHAGRADFVVSSPGGSLFRPVAFDPGAVRQALATHTAVLGLAPRWSSVVQARGSGASRGAMLVGVDPAAERSLDLWGLIPQPELAAGACAVSKSLAHRLGLQAGHRMWVAAGAYGPETELSVETVVERQLLLPQEVRDYVVVNESTARTLLGEPHAIHRLAGILRDPARYYDSRDLHASTLRLKRAGEALAEAVGPEYEVRLPKASALVAFQNLASPLRVVFGVIGLLALAITGLLVYSIVSVSVEERIREYAILRTLGARRGHIFRLVLGESLVLCGTGVVPGVIAGIVLARGLAILAGLALGAGAGGVPLAFAPADLAGILAAGIGLSVASALVPAVQATRWRIVDALDPLRRGQIRPAPAAGSGSTRPMLVTGLVLSALSGVVFFVLPAAFLSGNASWIGAVVLCLLVGILLGFTLIGAGALPWIEGVVLRILSPAIGPAAELARRNLSRHRRRNTTTAVMFILSVALVVFAASLVVLFSRMSIIMVEHFNGADIRVESEDPEALGLKTTLRAVPGVTQVSEVQFLRSRTTQGTAYDVVLGDVVGMKQLWLVPYGVDADLPAALYTNHVRWAEQGGDALARLAQPPSIPTGDGRAAEPAPIILSQSAASFLEVHAGDLVQYGFHLGPEHRTGRFRIAAVCPMFPGFDNFRARVANAVGSAFLMPLDRFRDLTRGVPRDAVLVRYLLRTRDDAAARSAAAEIRDRFDLQFRFGVKATPERRGEAQAVYWTTQVLFGMLLAVAVTIAVFSLIASMATAVIERRWETGMLKALGLRQSHLFRMFLAEALGLTLAAGTAGGIIGFALAWLFVLEAGALAEIPVVFALPYVTFLATLAVSAAAAVVAAHLPTRRLLARPAAEILRLES